MTNEEYLSSYKQVIWQYTHPDALTTLEDFPGVVLTKEIIDDIYSQLTNLLGQPVVYFVPGDDDSEMVKDNWIDNTQIVGTLTGVSRKDDPNQIGEEHVYVKVDIYGKYKNLLPFRGYALHVGLDSDHTVFDNDNPVKVTYPPNVLYTKYKIKSCKVKGVYWKDIRNFNHMFGSHHTFSYYNLRELNMFVYEPNRTYW